MLAKKGRYKIIGADANPDCPQFSLVDESVVLPFANSPNYMERLFEIIEQYEIKVLFHGCEPELELFSKHRDEIERLGVFLPINSTS